MNTTGSDSVYLRAWCAVAILLVAWNGLAASFACLRINYPEGVQYQLLARNRLQGHYEVGDATQVVGTEGRHPMWRPGLVWIEEGLGRCLNSVRIGAAAASALGTTLLELALLWLAWRCFGRKTWLFLLIALPTPAVSSTFLRTLAKYQGPEVWAAACVVAGLAALVLALQRHSWPWALTAGIIAGLAEWFRTGNLLLFAVPCAVYSLAALREQTGRQGDKETRRGNLLRPYSSPCLLVSLSPCLIPAGALVTFLGMTALGDLTIPSSVNKTVANLWHNAIENHGPLVTGELPDGTKTTFSMGGCTLAPGMAETNYDWVIRRSHNRSTLGYVGEHAWEIIAIYIHRLKEAAGSCFSGLRWTIGDVIVTLFAVQFLLCVAQREPALLHTFALAGAALAHYFGPVMLLKGDEPTHYLLVPFPLFLVVAGRGAHRLLVELVYLVRKCKPPVLAQPPQLRWPLVAVGLVVLVGLSTPFYQSAVRLSGELQQWTLEEQAAIDALGLEGRRVACRNTCWFVDRKVHTILLPYAIVPELETYVRDHGIDGILVWEKDPTFSNETPYGSAAEFDRALQQSALFGPPQASGAWRWYPVRSTHHRPRSNYDRHPGRVGFPGPPSAAVSIATGPPRAC